MPNSNQHTNSADPSWLIAGCIQRQPAAQKALVQQYAAPLLSVAKRYTRTYAAAEDVLQESLMRILDKIDTFDPEKGTLMAWMRRIVIHLALAHYRKMHFSHEQATEILPDPIDVKEDIFDKLSFEELLQLINTLPEPVRTVFNMAVLDHFSHDEIGAVLNIPAGTSRVVLSRARKLLQEKILTLQQYGMARI
jgi:RNA polymerase sigma factor (sigma-70 family)